MFNLENKETKAERRFVEHALLTVMKHCSMEDRHCLDNGRKGTCFYHDKIDYRTEPTCQSCECDPKKKHITWEGRQYHRVDQKTLNDLVHPGISELPLYKTDPSYVENMWKVTDDIRRYSVCVHCKRYKATHFCDCTEHLDARKPLCTACYQKKEPVGGCTKRCMHQKDCREPSFTTDLDGIDICKKHHEIIELTTDEKIVQGFMIERQYSIFRTLKHNSFVWTNRHPPHGIRHKIPFGKRNTGKNQQLRTEITVSDLYECMKGWSEHVYKGELETVRIVVEMMYIARSGHNTIYDLFRAGALASQATSGTTCTDLECFKTRYLCLYAHMFKNNLNPIAGLLGDSKEAIMIRDMPAYVSTMECICGYHDDSLDYLYPKCTCGLDDKQTRLQNKRSMAVGEYIRTNGVCRDI